MRKREREAGNYGGGINGRRQDSGYNFDAERSDVQSSKKQQPAPAFGPGVSQRALGSSGAVGSSTAAPSRGGAQQPARLGQLEADQYDSDDQPIDFSEQIANRDLFEFRFPR